MISNDYFLDQVKRLLMENFFQLGSQEDKVSKNDDSCFYRKL